MSHIMSIVMKGHFPLFLFSFFDDQNMIIVVSTSLALIIIGNVMKMITKMRLIAMTSVMDDRLARVIFVHEKQDQRLALIFRIIPSLYSAIPSNPL